MLFFISNWEKWLPHLGSASSFYYEVMSALPVLCEDNPLVTVGFATKGQWCKVSVFHMLLVWTSSWTSSRVPGVETLIWRHYNYVNKWLYFCVISDEYFAEWFNTYQPFLNVSVTTINDYDSYTCQSLNVSRLKPQSLAWFGSNFDNAYHKVAVFIAGSNLSFSFSAEDCDVQHTLVYASGQYTAYNVTPFRPPYYQCQQAWEDDWVQNGTLITIAAYTCSCESPCWSVLVGFGQGSAKPDTQPQLCDIVFTLP